MIIGPDRASDTTRSAGSKPPSESDPRTTPSCSAAVALVRQPLVVLSVLAGAAFSVFGVQGGLLVAAFFALLTPGLVLASYAYHEQHHTRAGRLADRRARWHAITIAEGAAWGIHRRSEPQPDDGLILLASRLLFLTIDLAMLLVGLAAIIGAVVVAPGWAKLAVIPLIPLLGAAIWAVVKTWRIARHQR